MKKSVGSVIVALLFLFCSFFTLGFFIPTEASASVRKASLTDQLDYLEDLDDILSGSVGYETLSFNVEASARENGTIHMQETITVNFTQPSHGIFRYIPYDPSRYKIKNVEVPDYKSKTTDQDSVYTVIQIGDENKTVRGRHTYTILYDIVMYADNDPDSDSLLLDLLSTEWETSIRKSTMKLTMPKDVDPDSYRF